MGAEEPVPVLHVITRLDRGGSAENTLLTASTMEGGRFTSTVAVGPTRGERSPTERLARERGVSFVEVEHLVRPIRPLSDLSALCSLWSLMRRGDFRIVHTHTSKAGMLGRLAARLARIPVVVHTPHGHVFYGYYGAALTRLFVWLERRAARWTDRIVALTAADRDEHLHFRIAASDKFAVIHSGVDFGAFAAAGGRQQTRRALGLAPQELVVGTVGRLTAVKAQGDLLRAFAAMCRRVDGARLLLVGEGEARRSLEELAAHLALGARVLFAGWRRDVPALLRAMDIFALPSLNEGMGKALVEAMYAGLAVVASRVGGIPELVEHGKNGLLVPARRPELLAAALVDLAQDARKRRDLGARAARRARQYSAGRMVESIAALYEGLLEEKGLGGTQGEEDEPR